MYIHKNSYHQVIHLDQKASTNLKLQYDSEKHEYFIGKFQFLDKDKYVRNYQKVNDQTS